MIHSNLICQKTFRNNNNPAILPSYHTKVKPTKSTPLTLRISTFNSMKSMTVDHFDESKNCFNYIHHHLDDEEMLLRCNCAFVCVRQAQNPGSKCSSARLPLLQDEVALRGIV